EPGNSAGDPNAGFKEWHKAIVHSREVFAEMLNDIVRVSKRCKHIDKAKQLHFEVLVSHRKRHHPLVKASPAENRLRITVNQFDYPLTSTFYFTLERTHGAILTLSLKL